MGMVPLPKDTMKTHIKLLQQLPDISAILAALSLFSFEYAYEHDADTHGVRVVDSEDEAHTRLVYLAGHEEPVAKATERKEALWITATSALLESQPLCTMFAAMGLKAYPDAQGFTYQANFAPGEITPAGWEYPLPLVEVLWNRVKTLDSLWVANRRLAQFDTDQVRIATNLIKIFDAATTWAHRRLIDLNGDAQLVDPQATDQVLADLSRAATWGIPGLVGIKIHQDPRGDAFELQFEDGYTLGVSPCDTAWSTMQPAGSNKFKLPASITQGRFAIKPTKIKPEVLAVLDGLVVQGKTVRIAQRLAPKLYAKVNEMLQTIGGHWHTGAQAHVFEDDPQELLEEMTATGAIYTRKDFEFFATTPVVVPRVIQLADLEYGMKLLEPSAGDGALALPAAEIVGKENVTCFELMERNVRTLKGMGFAIEIPQDFLTVAPEPIYDRIILNPPFSGGRDAAHIQHAFGFLKPGGRLVAIASTQWQTHDTAPAKAFQSFLAKWGAKVEQIEAGAFKDSGTNVPTTLIVLAMPAAVQNAKVPSRATAECKPTHRGVAVQADLFAA